MSPSATRTRVPTVDLPVERFDLSCGARLLVSCRPGAPIVAVQVHVRGGPALDPDGHEGTAYMSGRMLDQGSKRFDEEKISEMLESSGGGLTGDAYGISGNIAAASWKTLVEILCDVVTQPTYPAKNFARQKQRILDRLLLERDDPRAQADHMFRRLVYGQHWLGRPQYGTLESISELQRTHVKRFHRSNWLARRTLIAFCGDVDPESVRRLFEQRLKAWTSGSPLPPMPMDFPAREVRVAAFPAERQQVHVNLGHLGIKRKDPDYPALVVMDHVLGTGPGFTNRVSKRLRDELGLAYTVSANIHGSAGLQPGTFTAYIGTSPEHVDTAIRGFLEEMRRIQDEPVGERELQLAKDYLVGAFVLSFQRASRRANYMISAERLELPEDNLTRLPRLFAAIGPEDVQRAARKHLHADACCLSAAGPIDESSLKAALGAGVRKKKKKRRPARR